MEDVIKYQYFEQAYHKYSDTVLTNIYKYVKNETLAADLLQETFLALWEELAKDAKLISIDSWLFVVSRNKALATLRAEIKKTLLQNSLDELEIRDLPEDEQLNTALLEEKQLLLIKEAVSQLSKRKEQIFILNKYEGKSVEEISENLGISVSSVKEYLREAVREIRRTISIKKDTALVPILILLALID